MILFPLLFCFSVFKCRPGIDLASSCLAWPVSGGRLFDASYIRANRASYRFVGLANSLRAKDDLAHYSGGNNVLVLL